MPFPVEERFIRAIEEKLCVRFPPSFVAKMLKENDIEEMRKRIAGVMQGGEDTFRLRKGKYGF